MSNDLSVWGDKNLSNVPKDMGAYKKVQLRRTINFIRNHILDSVEPYQDEDGKDVWPEWTNETWREHLGLTFDFYIDKRIVQKYYIESAEVVNGLPSAEIYIVPVQCIDYINLKVEITKESVDFLQLNELSS